jgi:ribosome biogenesis protein MAK21
MGFARKRSADEARAGGSRPERTFPKKEYPKKEYSKKEYPKKEGGEQKAKKTPLVCDLPLCCAEHAL